MADRLVFSRASFLKFGTVAAAGTVLAACGFGEDNPLREVAEPEVGEGPVTGPDDALKRLEEGNARFVKGETTDLNEGADRRAALTKEQKPFALILGCTDSQVPPELIFDRGFGDLMVVRAGGEVLDHSVIGSLEFGVKELGIPLLMVLGHENCGAVKASLTAISDNDPNNGEGDLAFLVNEIAVNIRPVKDKGAGKDPAVLLDDCVKANARGVASALPARSPVIKEAVDAGKLKIVTAYYDLDSGKADLL